MSQTPIVRRPLTVLGSAGATLLLLPAAAQAHHPLGGATPESFLNGFLSGVGHPMIGVDHFAFVVAAGIASAFLATRFLAPALFVIATIAGCLMTATLGITLPLTEMVIAASVLGIGAVVMSNAKLPDGVLTGAFGLVGLFHGSAYAGAIIGAETTPLLAYLIGFAVVQGAILLAARQITRWLADVSTEAFAVPLQSRLAGAMVAGVGATFMIEHIEAMAFPGM